MRKRKIIQIKVIYTFSKLYPHNNQANNRGACHQVFVTAKQEKTPMHKRQISLKDIAQELHLSISTVSRAIRNVGEVSPETRKAVIKLAQKYNYQPNPLALGLLRNKTRLIGVVIPEIESHYFNTILRGIDHVASSGGYRIITSYTNDSQSNEIHAINELQLSRVEGIIACVARDSIDFVHLHKLTDSYTPLVLFSRDCEELLTTKVLTDNINSGFELTEHLINNGCRRIAYITSLEPMSEGRQRFEGYRKALEKYRIEYNRELIIHGNLNLSTSIEGTKNLLKLKPLPDAIIGNNDTVAMAAMKVVKEAGLSIPKDICISGYSDDPFSSFLEPSLTSVSQPAYLTGMRSMEVMLDMIKETREINKPERIVLQSALVIRESTQRKPKKA